MSSQPTPKQIQEWKLRYEEIFSADSPRGDLYVFRSLTIEEQTQLRDMAEKTTFFDAEEFIVSCGVLFPDKEIVDQAPTSFVSSIANEIRAVSGFGDVKTAKALLDRAREEASLVINVAKTYVLATMPAYKEEDLNQLTFAQLCHKVSLAERIIEMNQQIMMGNQVTMEIIDPEEIAELERQEAEKKRKAEEKRKQQAARFAKHGSPIDADTGEPMIKPRLVENDPIAEKLRSTLG